MADFKLISGLCMIELPDMRIEQSEIWDNERGSHLKISSLITESWEEETSSQRPILDLKAFFKVFSVKG